MIEDEFEQEDEDESRIQNPDRLKAELRTQNPDRLKAELRTQNPDRLKAELRTQHPGRLKAELRTQHPDRLKAELRTRNPDHPLSKSMFDPNLPIENTEIDAVQMRGQLTGLKDLIDAVQSVTSVQVDGVDTLNPGDAASVSLSVIGSVLHFSFGIPRGNDGASATPITSYLVDATNTLDPGTAAAAQVSFDGNNVRFIFDIPRGFDGQPGGDGQPGPPFAQAVVDGVTTLNPGDNATVDVSFDGSNVRFQFGIPRGNDGGTGNDGQPGEVTNADLSSAIDGTSTNSNGVSTLNLSAAGSYDETQMQMVMTKLDELINALRR